MANLSAMYKSLLGPDALLKQVYEGEKMGVDAYDDRLDALDPESSPLCGALRKKITSICSSSKNGLTKKKHLAIMQGVFLDSRISY